MKSIEEQLQRLLESRQNLYSTEIKRQYSYTLLFEPGEKIEYVRKPPDGKIVVNLSKNDEPVAVVFEHGERAYRKKGNIKIWKS